MNEFPQQQQNYAKPLTRKLKMVAEYVGQGMSYRAAAEHAGVRCSETRWKKDPRFMEVVRAEQEKNAAAAQVRREDIIDGLKEAINLAKLVSDPHALIKAWAEMGRFCGFYAPEVRKLDISVTSKRVITQLESMSERELLQLANEELAQGLEGHFKRIPVLPRAQVEVVDAEIVEETPK